MAYYSLKPSSAAFSVGRNIITDSHNSCPRYMIFQAEIGRKTEIDPKYAIMGARGEDMYQEVLEQTQPWPFHKEFKVTDYFEGVKRNGRIDFLVHHQDFKVPHECKTTQSKYVFTEVFVRGNPKISHLAQLTFYLVLLSETRGKLIYRFWPTQETKIFKVEVGDKGELVIDGKASSYSIGAQLEHQLLCIEAITEQKDVQKIDQKNCRFCEYKDVCGGLDVSGRPIKDFLQEINNGNS